MAVGTEFTLETIAEEFVSMRTAEMVISEEFNAVVFMDVLLNK